MPEEVLANGQSGQTATPEATGGIATGNSATIPTGGQSAPETEQPLTLTQSQLQKFITDALNEQKQTWLNEAYQNTQSMNDKFEKRVNDTISAFEKSGIKTDKVSVAKYLREQDKQAQAQSQAQAVTQQSIDPAYSQFLQRFGAQRMAGDARLQGAFSLEQEYGIQLMRDDPEYTEFFGDPNKKFSSYQFQRDYEKALAKKKARANEKPQASIAGMPSMSGTGPKSNSIGNTTPSSEILARGADEMRRNMKY